MPITFRCPECGGLLSVPRKMQGQVINCKHNGCVVEVRGTATETGGGNGQHAVGKGSGSIRTVDPAGVKINDATSAKSDSTNGGPPAKRGDWLGRNVARFIKAEGAASPVQLAADGRLPELNLTESAEGRAGGEVKSSNPLVMIGVLCLSFIASALLLFVEPEASGSASSRQALARRQIATFYKEPRGTLEPYQQYLRDAQQAHSRGDVEAEKRLYRRVLNLLHAEGRSRFASLTRTPREDKELEGLLSILMSDE